MIGNLRTGTGLAAIAALAILVAGQAQALTFDPGPTALLHTNASGQPGAEWNTGGTTSGGEILYDSGTQLLTITAQLDVLNYYDPLDVTCATDVGSNCAHNYGAPEGDLDLDITLTASLSGITVTPIGGPFYEILVEFETAGGSPDLSITDPNFGDAVVLEGDIQAGTFGGSPTTGLQAQVLYRTDLGTAVFQDVNSVGFFSVDPSTLYASLFGSTFIGINLGTFSDFSPDLDTLASTAFATGVLGDFEAEANSQIFRSDTGEFVPEPTTTVMLALGLCMFGVSRRRS